MKRVVLTFICLGLAAGCASSDAPSIPVGTTGTDDAAAAPDTSDATDDRYWEAPVPAPPIADEPCTYRDHIAPVMNEWCAECHLGPSDWDCTGAAMCFVSFPELLTEPGCCTPENPFGTCEFFPPEPNTTFGHCVLYRIEATKRGDTVEVLISEGDPIVLPDVEIQMLKRWLDDGLPLE